jgi:FAD/FMN-containing dehydrogenase
MHWPPARTLSGFGLSSFAKAPLVQPDSVDELHAVLAAARAEGRSLALRGAGRSYGDAALDAEGVVLDLTRLNRIRRADWTTGELTIEPGVSIEQLWRTGLRHGYWPAVVPGTMFPTLGGCAAMNVHGKNNFKAGTTGDHIQAFDLLTADGELHSCSRDLNSDLFHAAIGGFGMLGVFTSLTLRMKHVACGDLMVTPHVTGSIQDMVNALERLSTTSDYMVGWVDMLGRDAGGIIHTATYATDSESRVSLSAAHQDLPTKLFGVVPKGWIWPLLWCAMTRPGMRSVNALKRWSGKRHAASGTHRQSLVGFSFLLDYVPNWRKAYLPGGFVQFQSFVPKARAADTFEELRHLSRRAGVQPFLGVMKKHRPDPFLLTHAVDGFSLALDFPVSDGTWPRFRKLALAMTEVVLAAGGRFYPAKDSVMTAEHLRRYVPAENLAQFTALKRRLDQGLRLRTGFSRRVLEPLL